MNPPALILALATALVLPIPAREAPEVTADAAPEGRQLGLGFRTVVPAGAAVTLRNAEATWNDLMDFMDDPHAGDVPSIAFLKLD